MNWAEWLRGGLLTMARIGIIVSAIVVGWTVQGWRKGAELSTLRESIATANAAAANARADQAMGVMEAERKAHAGMDAFEARYIKERDAAKNEKDAFIAGVRSGAIRLSVPVTNAVPAGAGRQDAGAGAGTGGEARAELTPAAAEFLDGIAAEGDDAIRQANAVIDAYNKVRDELNVQAERPAGISAEGR